MTCRIFSAASLVLFTTALILLVIVCLQTDLLIQTYTEDCSEEKGLPKVEHQATLGPFKGCLDSGGMGSQCGRVDGNCNIQGVSKYNFTECDDKSLQPQENEGGVYPYGQLCRVHISMEVIVIVACVFLFVCVVLQALSLSNISAKQCDRLTVIFGAVGGVCALVFLAFFGALPELAKNLGAESVSNRYEKSDTEGWKDVDTRKIETDRQF
uniref:Uncharacterized protein n=1 Tax=Chromera velia CCMP2878 TaxID=1169474 RepID=A0A0K6S7U5_9ALVE|eukprot:Cvel_22413.t2-p1 / transcript=Cvel_22413.t2 / gene=Cvel_22413 / organism=Chromera_velia_CCMP2878 / gene_product=hypothetical protein / transcript_product=hypothetical protein / location=Cvel_scaffold2199:23143-24371(+) / protein_length=210 / sequence_SO=supercontig / SO=protein_coding / is_pseudo=false